MCARVCARVWGYVLARQMPWSCEHAPHEGGLRDPVKAEQVSCDTGRLTHATPGWVPEPEHPLRGHCKANQRLSQPRTAWGVCAVAVFWGREVSCVS